MCGICGFVAARKQARTHELRGQVGAMTRELHHRGPDAQGIFVDERLGVALGHARLSIIDLSEAGAQPMHSHDGRWVICFNGEIYDFDSLRANLEKAKGPVAWRGGSDTEVLLEALAFWGIGGLRYVNGMFAFALLDTRDAVLYLARDRMGEKPLYLGWQGDHFLFGSELKCLVAHPCCSRELEPAAVAAYCAFAYVPTPWSIYRGIEKLPPGSFARIALGNDSRSIEVHRYWHLPRPQPRDGDLASCIDETEALIADAVRVRMRADVQMGAFLSGGIDSSLIVSLMQQHASSPVRTFSIGFAEVELDESRYAEELAVRVGTAHRRLVVTPDDALAVVPRLPEIYDEPFADSSQIPTVLLAHLTRRDVTVALSGDGGDELFGGYARYFSYASIWPNARRLPFALRSLLARVIHSLPAAAWDVPSRVLPGELARNLNARRAYTVARALGAEDGQSFFRRLVTFWSDGTPMLGPAQESRLFIDSAHIERDFADAVDGMAYLDSGSYLPDDILVKVDRGTMAASLEGRIPFLDHRLVEHAANLPRAAKVDGTVGKRVLRAILQRRIPDYPLNRPKQGFAIPLAMWLRGPLRAWAEELLFTGAGQLGGVFDAEIVRRAWRQHLAGTDRSADLWIVLMFLAWAQRWQPRA